tara:strand:- start:20 stop:1060 length:1041 start_codon:yes stop_codon:yes gene_type:complete
MNNYFCVLPFYSKEFKRPENTPCCLLPVGTNVDQLRQDMLGGKRSSACQKCWTLEDQEVKSDRQIKNETFDFYADKDIGLVEQDCKASNYSTRIVKVHTSNLCNSTCVTCNSGASSAWATLRKEKTFYIVPSDTFDEINYKDLVMLSFVGGEPLIEKKNFWALEQLIANNNTNCFISLVTNGSIELSDKQKDILAKFKNVNICLSIDGIEKRFEYMRYPLKWDTLLDNITFFRKLNFIVTVSYCVSNINAMYYQETVDWFARQNLPYNHNMVFDPSYFSPYALPIDIKNKINVSHIPKVTKEDDLVLFNQAIKELRVQDQLKRISIKDYMPEFFDIIQETYLSSSH